MFCEVYGEIDAHKNGADWFRQKSLLILGQHPIWETALLWEPQRRQLCAQRGWAAEFTTVSGRKPAGSNAGQHKGFPE